MITQTTLSLDDVAPIVDALGDHVGATLKRPAADDICYATQNRQDAVKEIVSMGASQILVIGSPTSSNAQRLVEVAQARGAQARLIEDEKAIDEAMLEGHETVGVTAGASTPEELVQAVLARLAESRVRRARRGDRRPRGRPLPASPAGGCEMTSIQIPQSVAAALPTLSVFDITNEVAARRRQPARPITASRTSPPRVPTSLVRVSERESGFFCDVEALLERFVPGSRADRERMLLALLGPRTEQIPFATAGSASGSGSACSSSASTATRAPTTR